MRSGHDSEIDAPVGLTVGQALDLGNVEIRIDLGALIVSSRIIRQDTGARLKTRYNGLSFVMNFISRSNTHSVDEDRSNPRLLEPGLETLKNGFGSPEVISVRLLVIGMAQGL